MSKVKEQVHEAPQVEASPPVVAQKRIRIGDRGFFRKGTARVHSADVVAEHTVTTPGGTSIQLLSVIYYDVGVHGWQDNVEKVTVGKEVGQWWHSLEDLEVEAGLVKREPEQRA